MCWWYARQSCFALLFLRCVAVILHLFEFGCGCVILSDDDDNSQRGLNYRCGGTENEDSTFKARDVQQRISTCVYLVVLLRLLGTSLPESEIVHISASLKDLKSCQDVCFIKRQSSRETAKSEMSYFANGYLGSPPKYIYQFLTL